MILPLGLVFDVAYCQLPITNCYVSDYVTKTESKTGSETKISNNSNTLDGKTESRPFFDPHPEVAKNLPKYCFYVLTALIMHHAQNFRGVVTTSNGFN